MIGNNLLVVSSIQTRLSDSSRWQVTFDWFILYLDWAVEIVQDDR